MVAHPKMVMSTIFLLEKQMQKSIHDSMSSLIFALRYAKPDKETKKLSSFNASIKKVMNIHRSKFKNNKIILEEIDRIEQLMLDGLLLPSQRSLQFLESILDKNERMYNCTAGAFRSMKFLSWAMFLLLCGSGVGFNISKHHIQHVERLNKPSDEKFIYKIGDSIEGWADSVAVLCQQYTEDGGKTVEFDFSDVRPAGALVRSSHSRAPGSEPLKKMLEKMRKRLDEIVESGGEVRPIDAHDLMCITSSCVVSGGVRRSAMISLFDHDDEEMLQCKTGDWDKNHPYRAFSNNSAMICEDSFLFGKMWNEETINKITKRVAEYASVYGEPGIVMLPNEDWAANPCSEIMLNLSMNIDDEKRYGFQFCNLVEMNVSRINDEQFYDLCRSASILSTIQASYTETIGTGYLSNTYTKQIVEKDALIGVSMTGVFDNLALIMKKDVLARGKMIVDAANREIAKEIEINSAARTTCVKPAGHTTIVFGCDSSGCNPPYSKFYIRRVKESVDNPVIKRFCEINPDFVEHDHNNPSICYIKFPIKCNSYDDYSAENHLDIVKHVSKHWIGTPTDQYKHNVSCTINVLEEEWPSFTKALSSSLLEMPMCISMLPRFVVEAGHPYKYLPMDPITEEHYEKMARLFKEINDDNLEGIEVDFFSMASACDGGKCELK